MKSSTILLLAATLLGGFASGVRAESIHLKQCPESVIKTIQGQVGPGRIDKIKCIRLEGRVLYLAEIDLPGRRERKLHVGGDGTLLKVIDEVRLADLPRPVRIALDPFLVGDSHFDNADKVTAVGKTEYHVDIELGDDVDLHLVLGEGGEILRRTEEGDF